MIWNIISLSSDHFNWHLGAFDFPQFLEKNYLIDIA